MVCPCCLPPSSCNDCCGSWPSELTVDVVFTLSSDACVGPSVSLAPSVLLDTQKTLSSTVTLTKIAAGLNQCALYKFSGCGVFGDFVQLTVTVVFFYSGNKCLASAAIDATLCMCVFLGPTLACGTELYCPGALRPFSVSFSSTEYAKGCGNLPCFDATFTRTNSLSGCNSYYSPSTTTNLEPYVPTGCGGSSLSSTTYKGSYDIYARVCQ